MSSYQRRSEKSNGYYRTRRYQAERAPSGYASENGSGDGDRGRSEYPAQSGRA